MRCPSNLPLPERVARLLIGILVSACAVALLTQPLYRWSAAATGIVLAATALIGFCPARAALLRLLGIRRR